MRHYRCYMDFDSGYTCHECTWVRQPKKDGSHDGIMSSAKAFASERGFRFIAVAVNAMSKPPVMVFSAPVPKECGIRDDDMQKLGFEGFFGDEYRRLCFVVPCGEVGEFLEGFDAPIDFLPVQRRLEHMGKDVDEIRKSLYAVGEHQTLRAAKILKETGKREQHQ